MVKKIALIAIILIVAIALTGCAGGLMTATSIHTEADDTGNNLSEELTGFTLNGSDWYQIDGSFSSSSDSDEYRIDLGGRTTVNIHVFHNGTEVTDTGLLIPINYFPITAVQYSASDSVLTNLINSATGNSFTVESGADYIIFDVYAAGSTLFGDDLPYTSGTYTIQVQ